MNGLLDISEVLQLSMRDKDEERNVKSLQPIKLLSDDIPKELSLYNENLPVEYRLFKNCNNLIKTTGERKDSFKNDETEVFLTFESSLTSLKNAIKLTPICK